MRGRTPAEAVASHLESLQQLVSCVTDEVVRASGYRPDDQPHVLMLARGGAVPLAGGILSTALRIRQRYTIAEHQAKPSRERW